jgi:hypothetical protein
MSNNPVVYSKKYNISRGPLSSIRCNYDSDNNYFNQDSYEEDIAWEIKVIESALTLDDSIIGNYNYFDQCENEYLFKLWDIYKRELCQNLTIGFKKEGCFRRSNE